MHIHHCSTDPHLTLPASYVTFVAEFASPEAETAAARMLRLIAALERHPTAAPIWAACSWFGLVFSTTPDHAKVVIRADPGADGYDLTFPHSLLRPTVDGAVRTQHLRDPDAAAAAVAEVYLAIVALYGHAPLP